MSRFKRRLLIAAGMVVLVVLALGPYLRALRRRWFDCGVRAQHHSLVP